MVEDYTWDKALDRQLTKSLRIALDVHGEKKDPITNEPLFSHVIKVMHKVEHPFEKMIAVLYCTNLTEFTMYDLCIPTKVIDGIMALNLKPSESYQQYLNRIKKVNIHKNVLIAILRTKLAYEDPNSTFSTDNSIFTTCGALKELGFN